MTCWPRTWARAKVDDLMSQDWLGLQRGTPRDDLRDAIPQLGLDYRLMTQYTSFVAVEETTIVEGGKPRRIEVPVEMPEGVSYEGVYGREVGPQPVMLAKRAFALPAAVGGFAGQRAEAVNDARTLPAQSQADSGIEDFAEARGVTTGRVTVLLWISDTSEQTLAKLKALGVEVLAKPRSGKVLMVRVAAEKLQAIAAMAEVKYIAPGS